MFRVWNADKAKWVMGETRMCKRAAHKIADAVEQRLGGMCVVVPA